jgi:hypothetical protein
MDKLQLEQILNRSPDKRLSATDWLFKLLKMKGGKDFVEPKLARIFHQ